MNRWIVFKTESASSKGWKERKLQPAGHLTRMLAEYLDCSDKALPEPGDRRREFARFEESVDPNFPDASTRVRWSDWEVSRVERFKSVDSVEYDEIVACYCRYSPIEPEWKELPKVGVLQEDKSPLLNALSLTVSITESLLIELYLQSEHIFGM